MTKKKLRIAENELRSGLHLKVSDLDTYTLECLIDRALQRLEESGYSIPYLESVGSLGES
jgi:hypothetical protein